MEGGTCSMEKLPSSVPSAKQLQFQEWNMGLFLHFGIRTFNEGFTDFDHRKMELDTFNPIELNCEQWMETAQKAGLQYAVLTAKHHDGFANWPSKYTDYSIANTPWKNGQGDVIREYVDACRKYGIKPGLYYSLSGSTVYFRHSQFRNKSAKRAEKFS
jgi:alpha-L-fucosidase